MFGFYDDFLMGIYYDKDDWYDFFNAGHLIILLYKCITRVNKHINLKAS